jgi:uncharacterized protein YbjT (DUF2867 family)
MARESILVTGATGRLGRIIVRDLLTLGHPTRAFTRRPQIATSLFGKNVEIAEGDFLDAGTLDRAFSSVDRVLLLSPISEHLAAQQQAVIDAALRNGASRVVKISGSDWTIEPEGRSISGAAHFEVERHLAASGLQWAALRPNAWMQVSLPGHIANVKAGKGLSSTYGDARVGFIDARDISAVAVNQLLAERVANGPLVLTGSEAITVRDIAGIAARLLHKPIVVTEPVAGMASAELTFEQRAVREFMVLLREGRAAQITNIVPELLGRAPRTVEAYLAEHLERIAA